MLIADLVLPGMSGRELAGRLRIDHPTLKVLFVSGYTDRALPLFDDLEPGMAFVQKPFTPQSLLAQMRALLDGA